MTAPEGPPLVGVVVPVYRVEAFVTAALDSVRAQTWPHWECVVVDDGSPDGSARLVAQVVAAEPRVRLVRQENRGLAGARNTGLQHLSPEVSVVAFLDSDDVWCPDHLEVLVTALRADPAAVGAYGYAELLDGDGDAVDPGLHPSRQRDRRRVNGRRLVAVPPGAPLTFDEAVVVSPLYPPAVAVFRREVVDRVGPFDQGLTQMEDWDFYQRVLRHGPVLTVPQQVAWYRVHGGQMTRRVVEAVHQHDLVRRKVWRSPENTAAQRRVATRAWRQLQLRRTARAAQRLLGALRRREWGPAARLALGTAVVAAQNLGSGPPRPSTRILRWTGRTGG
ncbi:glycosyltransferase family A protein [Klenkia sp. PcliD-1-E]|uniref:glycosyltransferase family 2 protein n=1 Tax=Klenkia sp. PcliD-1-E TaxID=2954492 RepID=UPI0020984F97|nr:glycosyltransferase family A protein [Klenkia sp. PcliD-1-E]MCO7220224.1 glycosyltransferase family 2 protein [Klenkia sp. PcliD-1-E]